MMKKIAFLYFIFGISSLSVAQEWRSLINGKDLKNWTQIGDKAKYTLENEVIVGTAIPKSSNSFLTTKESFGDFILEFEVYMNSDLNSGVMFRASSDKGYKNGAYYGYQLELDPSSRAFSGGIYDEQRRLWMYPLSRNTKAQAALKRDYWNKIRLEAVGSQINTWINGIQCARLYDDLTPSGTIGLQVHGIWNDTSLIGAQVKWRNIRILTENLEEFLTPSDPQVPEISFLVNELSEWEKRNGFRLLWDGSTMTGWQGKNKDILASGWTIEQGTITSQELGPDREKEIGDIWTADTFNNFELLLEFRIEKGANSGVKYLVAPLTRESKPVMSGFQYQIVDDVNNPEAEDGIAGNQRLASLYDLVTADNLSVPGRGKQFKGIGTWNQVRIVHRDGVIEHWLNGEKTVEADRNSQLFKALITHSIYHPIEGFNSQKEGHILLQGHNSKVSFRSIKIREMN